MRGIGDKTIEQLKASGYATVEDIAKETDLGKLGNVPGVGIKKARQVKAAAEHYLLDEAKRRTELDAQRAANAAAASAAGGATPPTAGQPTA